MVLQLSPKMPTDITAKTFAGYLAEAYRFISEQIHQLSYSIQFEKACIVKE